MNEPRWITGLFDFLDGIQRGYSNYPDDKLVKSTVSFFNAFKDILPNDDMRSSFSAFISKYPAEKFCRNIKYLKRYIRLIKHYLKMNPQNCKNLASAAPQATNYTHKSKKNKYNSDSDSEDVETLKKFVSFLIDNPDHLDLEEEQQEQDPEPEPIPKRIKPKPRVILPPRS